MRLRLIAAAYLLFNTALAVFADEAWNVDYHYALFGKPQADTTAFHRPNPESKASLLYTLSEQGVLGAVNPRDGTIVWRHLLAKNATRRESSFLRAGDGQDVVVSGIGNQVAAWSALDGRQSWSASLAGKIHDVEILELKSGEATPSTKDAVVLSGGEHSAVQRIDGGTGATRWTYRIEGGDAPYQVSVSDTEVFMIVLHKTMLGYIKIKVLSLDPVTGHKRDEHSLSSENELATADTIVAVGANSASPIVAWTDVAHSVLKVNIIGTKQISSFDIDKHGDQALESVRIHAPFHTNSLPHFLVQYTTSTSHWAEVFHIDLKTSKIVKAYSLPKVTGKGAFATSSVDANVYFTRVTHNEIMTVSSSSHGILGRWQVHDFGVGANAGEVVEPIHAACELSMKGDTVSAIRSAILLSTGEWVLLREGSPIWHRPEVLAGTVSATFASHAVVEDFARQLEMESHSNSVAAYLHRLQRHVADLQYLPALLTASLQRLFGNSAGTGEIVSAAGAFAGFNMIIVCATEDGRLIAIDAANPYDILWNHQVADFEAGEAWQPEVHLSADPSILAFSSVQGANLEYFNATSGKALSGLPSQVASEARSMPNVRYSLRDGKLEAQQGESATASTWNFIPAADERIVGLTSRPVNDPVASIGKVLGDRRVLYKYLDPNLALLVTAKDAAKTFNIYVLDTINGAILYSNAHSGVDLSSPIASTMSENWFAYSYTAEASVTATKGHALVVGEIFESLIPNDRGPLSATSNFSSMSDSVEPFTLVHTYQIPEAISKMSVTQTAQGITSRQLLAVLADSSSIVGIPYGVLDPRRPVDREPTKDEQAEGLVRYSAVIDFDPQWYVNHRREVLGIDKIITSPALIESTSLVFAHGLDIFGTRLTPSFSFDILGKDFNKFQMLATVGGLAVVTFAVAPLVSFVFAFRDSGRSTNAFQVARKQVNARWHFL